ncbi:MAG: hypothetical protein OWV35_07500 [Firmicutes bacterium]|nr:hypothetical protein [Bacillota bacterium]
MDAERWWDVWDRVCAAHLDDYDLGEARITDGETALVIERGPRGVPHIVIDQVLVVALTTRQAGFLLTPLLTAALTRWRGRGRVRIALPPEWRAWREQIMRQRPS